MRRPTHETSETSTPDGSSGGCAGGDGRAAQRGFSGRLAIGVRGLRTVQVDGVTLDEGGPTVGVALDAANDGLVWMMVALH